jgi:serine O-acetyltransferase
MEIKMMATVDNKPISATEADWQREQPRGFWDPSRKLLKAIRQYQYWRTKGLFGKLFAKTCVLRHGFWSVICGADIPLNCKIGGGLSIPHPNGIVIHPSATIGVNCLIHQQVTIGVKRGGKQAPGIQGHVDIGAGAKIIGAINIGEHAMVGANAVVVKDVLNHQVVAGIPAVVIKQITH